MEESLQWKKEYDHKQGYLNFCAGAPTDECLCGSLYERELVCNLPWTSLVNTRGKEDCRIYNDGI